MKKLVSGTAIAMAMAFGSTGHAQDTQAPGYMIANYTIKDQAAPKFGGKIIVFNLNATAVEGKPQSVMAIAEFPSVADAQRFYDSPEYTAARKFRVASTEGSVVITEGFVPPKQ